jgi:S1-C subfamily serine protease
MRGSGSGVIIEPDGLIITNRHVVDGADTVIVVLGDGTVLDGDVVGVDTLTDFAFVKVEADEPLPTVQLGESSDLKLGQRTIVMGNPLGQFPGSVSVGIISGLDRSLAVADITGGGTNLSHLIQTDAAVNPGNSGGAVLDGDGKLIGIATAQAGFADGIGFALPIDLAKPIIEQVSEGRPIARPWIGIRFVPVTAELAREESLDVTAGALIQAPQEGEGEAILPGSPAEDAGLKAGDIITALDGQTVDGTSPLDVLLLQHAPGDQVTLTVMRDGEQISVPLTLGTRPADLGR